MKMIYFTGVDNGDGSIGVDFYESQECIDLLEKYDFEMYRGEGGNSFAVDGEIHGINVQTLEQVRRHISEHYGVDVSL